MGVINWVKWTKVLTSADKKFIDIYNFEIPLEEKTPERILNLSYVVLMEEASVDWYFGGDVLYRT